MIGLTFRIMRLIVASLLAITLLYAGLVAVVFVLALITA